MPLLRRLFPSFLRSILTSYTQIFFSNDLVFGVLLLLVTFLNPFAGLAGVSSVMVANTSAYLIGFNRINIKSGYYGFNSLLVGLGIGVFYQPGVEFYFLLFFASLFTLFLTVVLEGVVGKYGLPYLSLSFLAGIWMVTLASRQFTTLTISESGIYNLNEMYSMGGTRLVAIYQWFNDLPWHLSIKIYFRSLGAIYFQYHLFAGLLIAAGILYYSRIAFSLSLLGYFTAYAFYQFIGGNFAELSYGYIGFNFILTAIAIGGFFIIPSRNSYLWVMLLTPLISIVITSISAVFSIFQLSIFSLPFNLIVLVFLYALKFRERFTGHPEVVLYQQFSPEKNLYAQRNFQSRFKNFNYIPISLPFWGEWKITQGQDGKHTHQKEWKHAWDFELLDLKGSNYSGNGTLAEDFYGFNKPVIAPADGWVEEVLDGIEDNPIGQIDLHHNWGNTIIIKHADGLYTKTCHLKNGSILVKPGDHVKKGDRIANCGNSGRSPVPHIHFQIQSTPFIGSKTLDYPLGNYILRKDSAFLLQSYEKPLADQCISNIEKNPSLFNSFHFIPGQKIRFTSSVRGKTGKPMVWEVASDIYNNTFIRCTESGSRAYFRNDGTTHYFTSFEGSRSSLLFLFYLGAYKIIGGFYKDLEVNDSYPLSTIRRPVLQFFQDFVAPFFLFMKAEYSLRQTKMENDFTSNTVWLASEARVKIFRKVVKELNFEMQVNQDGLQRFCCTDKKGTTELIFEN